MNKSYYYVFPTIFYKLIDDGVEYNLINFVQNTYLTNNNGNFIIKLNNLGDELDKIVEQISKSEIIVSTTKTEENYIIEISVEWIEDLISDYVNGLYSKINPKYFTDIIEFSYNYADVENYQKIGFILYKDEILKKAIAKKLEINVEEMGDLELDSKCDIKEETYDA